MKRPPGPPGCGVLASGGLDSSILLHRMTRDFDHVVPIYVRSGLAWEAREIEALRAFVAAAPDPLIEPLVTIDLPLGDVLGEHWSVTGDGVPDELSRDDAVSIPGRNLVLLAKAALYAALHNLSALALGILRGNPFKDATPEFLLTFQGLTTFAVDRQIKILAPFAQMNKLQVLRHGRDLPLEKTFSCLRPAEGEHCGRCNKCTERKRAFQAAGIEDSTAYRG